ncbi:UNVERIFIED_CONTAM: hypothetical protein FKN15_032961, partial [Acipenser sinensis]
PLDACYTPEQRAAILQVLNTASESELSSVKMLRGRKSSNIIEYRTRNGPFKDLHSVMNVPLLKHKTTAVVFNSILNPADRSERRKPKVQAVKFIKPQIERKRLEEASSVVSLVFGTNKIAWAHQAVAVTLFKSHLRNHHASLTHVPGKLKQFVQDLHSGKLHREFHHGPDPTDVTPGQQDNQEEVASNPPESSFQKLAPSETRYTILNRDRDEL